MPSSSLYKQNPIQGMISSLVRQEKMLEDSSYLILLQHSIWTTRMLDAKTTTSRRSDDDQLYRQAKLRTPAENAARDATGFLWLQYLCRSFVKSRRACRLVVVQTTGILVTTACLGILESSVHIVETFGSDPFGWNKECFKDDVPPTNLENLEELARAIECQLVGVSSDADTFVVVVLESLSPIIMRHGVSRTFSWLRRLLTRLHCPVILPVSTDILTSTQHQALEDMADAVLSLHAGDMTLIRHGVREQGNVIREIVPFRLVQDREEGLSIEVGVEESMDEEDEHEQTVEPAESAPLSAPAQPPISDSTGGSSVQAKSGKVKLKLEDDSGPVAATTAAISATGSQGPRIYMQDNDPEFEDFDEDDPDDDLDI